MAAPMDCSSSYPIGRSPLSRVPPPGIILSSRSFPVEICISAHPPHPPAIASATHAAAIVFVVLLCILAETPALQKIFDLLVGYPVPCHAIDRVPMLLGDANAIGVAFRDLV